MKRSLILLLTALATLGAGCTQGQKTTLKPVKPSNTVATTTPTIVAGMTKYTNDKYGFTFWHPANLNLEPYSNEQEGLFPGGIVLESYTLDRINGPIIHVVQSTSGSITDLSPDPDLRGSPANATKYFYNSSTKRWMVAYPEDTRHDSRYATSSADVSNNTIGELPILPSGIRYDASIIPLSPTLFLVISDSGMATAPALAKTVYLNDANIDQKILLQALENEGVAFRGLESTNTNSQPAVKSDKEKPLSSFSLNTRYYTVVSSHDFLFNGTTGTVSQACEMPLVHVAMPIEYGYLCMGHNMLYMDLEGKRTIISEFTPDNLGDAKTLFDVGKAGNNVLVSFDQNACLYPESLCVQPKQYTYRISLQDRKVHLVNAEIEYMFTFRQFVWNPSGTKGVMAAGCPEGCPAEKYYGVDVMTGKSTLLLKQVGDLEGNDLENFIVPRVEDISWKDDKTAIIRGKEYSF